MIFWREDILDLSVWRICFLDIFGQCNSKVYVLFMSSQKPIQNLSKSRKKKRKANSPLSPLDTCSTPSTRNPGKASVEKVYTTSQAGSTSHCVFKPEFSTPNTQFISMTSPVGSYPQPLFGFTPSPHPHMMQTPQPTTPVPSYACPGLSDHLNWRSQSTDSFFWKSGKQK